MKTLNTVSENSILYHLTCIYLINPKESGSQNVLKEVDHALAVRLSSSDAFGKLGPEHSTLPSATQTLLSCSPSLLHTSMHRLTHAKP